MNYYKINPENENLSIKVILERIDRGYELQDINRELTEDEMLKYNGAIILTPDYQREYRFTLDDEVKLIESVLIGIPVPPIFLATDKFNEARVTNVVDGQHRLRALHRFYNNQFSLNKLTLLDGFDGRTFKELDIDIKSEFIEQTLLITIFKDFPGKEFELEIFNRYNKGTKPLSPQEIRHAVYNSEFNRFINSFTVDIYKNREKDPQKEKLKIAYNVSKDRIQKKKVQEGLFVIFSILERGINTNYQKSFVYAENYMKEKAELEVNNNHELLNNFNSVKQIFMNFNNFILDIQNKCEYPFSKEIYGISSRNYKFQISIAMILAGVFNKLIQNEEIYKKMSLEKEKGDTFLNILKNNLTDSFLEDPNYNASSTNSKEIYKLVEKINSDIVNQLKIYTR
ncbi:MULTISPECIES: DUF262 domain-containing protein [Bacillus]|uniref:DUF262 domain-containing protein n=1 Tax=Bacillus TaxID=1386 RepID=UPI0005303A8D|nr:MULTISPECIES: DUF262 domain-containing protein [Bacillus subtilis group]AIX09663.1 hypothetical protein OB04_04046 [Bacillus subtilis]MCY8153967.1 DUF262 domain-containing protein [Bacillus spizizenii]MCY9354948.1 DUF262 domain-containing protein [Bacillus spizizenii]MEC1527242.1 DUF262 domain-containing protein [Bacillus spizizenii]